MVIILQIFLEQIVIIESLALMHVIGHKRHPFARTLLRLHYITLAKNLL
jgi:hypothetical protein